MSATARALRALGAALLCGLAGLPAALLAAEPTRRVALLVGANDGGPDRPRLRYATEDARAMGQLLGELGGVAGPDRILLLDPDAASLRSGIAALQRRITAAGGGRTEVVFYYSGHSDERGLLLGEQRLDYVELRGALHALSGDVRIAILDSCASGALVSAKGGQHVSGFLSDQANKVEGHAFLTSSSASEVSQEAESVGGSFFTNALLTGLRGGADVNTDGQVTLNEAYRFAYDETLARTETTRFGPQHANFDIQLSGSGDLVMTDLRARTAPLAFAPGLAGRLALRDPSGRLVAELDKRAGATTTLWVEPGPYTLTWQGPSGPARATLKIDGTATTTVGPTAFSSVPMLATLPRGDGDPRPTVGAVIVEALERREEAGVPAGDRWIFNALVEGDSLEGTAVGLVTTHFRGEVAGAQLAFGGNSVDHGLSGAQLALGLNEAGGAVAGAQLSLGANTAGAVRGGAQGAVGVNFSAAEVAGAQASVGANLAGADLLGAQLSTGVNVARGAVQGLQLSQGVNLAGVTLTGAQITVGYNWAPQVSGAQITAGVNQTTALQGAQVAGLLNQAGQVQGAQLGLINTTASLEGAQLGLVNHAKQAQGSMLGLVNIAQHVDGNTVGLLNLVGNGVHDLELGGRPSGDLSARLKLGGPRVYTSFVAGYALVADPLWRPLSGGLGLGLRPHDGILVWDLEADAVVHTAARSADYDIDTAAQTLQNDPVLLSSARTTFALGLHHRFQPYWTSSWFLSVPNADSPSPAWVGGQPLAGGRDLRQGWHQELGLRVALGPDPKAGDAP